jgi:hypothetical protein
MKSKKTKTGRKTLPMSGIKSLRLRTKLITILKPHLDRYSLISREQVKHLDNLSRVEWLLRRSLKLEIDKTGSPLLQARSIPPKTVLPLRSQPKSCAIMPSYVAFTLVLPSRRSFRGKQRSSSCWRPAASTTAPSSAK